ncbi:MAG: cell wall hydrolase [Lachnospiraceae bacterium]|nr:cell wall hydrolase [Lachnospiraceae bacterium]
MNISLKRKLKVLASLTCIFALVFSSFTVFADDESTLVQQTSSLEEQLANLNQELVAISDEIELAEMQLELTQSGLIRTEEELEIATANEAQQLEDMKVRIRYIYEMGSTSLLEFLLSAQSIAEFINKAEFIQNINLYDRNMLDQLRDTQNAIQDKRDAMVAQENALVEIGLELESKQADLEAAAEATSTDLATFQAQLTQLRAENAARAAEELARANAAAAAAAAAAEREYLAANAPNTPPNSSEANQVPPNDGGVIHHPPAHVGGDELMMFAAILQTEAFHNYEYKLAVATIVMNRVASPLFPNTITDVILQPGQFQPTWTGSFHNVLAQGPNALSIQVAQDAINGARHAAVLDCLFFLTASSTNRPGINIGGNLFFQRW